MLTPKQRGYIISALRRIWRWSDERRTCIREANNRCASCKATSGSKKNVVDHKEPVVPVREGFTGWDAYINRLFCDKSNLQVLCKVCHKHKSREENAARKRNLAPK